MDPPYHEHAFDGALAVIYNAGTKENAGDKKNAFYHHYDLGGQLTPCSH